MTPIETHVDKTPHPPDTSYIDFLCFVCGKHLDPVIIRNYELVMLPNEPFPVFCRDCLSKYKSSST